jgi:geranylgeranyl diphosphate synthase type II
MPEIREILSTKTREIDDWMHWYFKRLGTKKGYPRILVEAAEYALFSGGKRIRPVLALLVNEACGSAPSRALPLAAAVEMIHIYSCVHDDLPAMDDDDFRRGRATCHRQYDEVTAILAGDALLTEAFAALSLAEDRDILPELVLLLAEAAGFQGMVAGQMADIAAEKAAEKGGPDACRRNALAFIHAHKTGALLVASVLLPGVANRLPQDKLDSLRQFGESLGLAFQIVDDILNETADEKTLGKPTGTDREAGKLTWVTLFGLQEARAMAKTEVDRALQSIEFFGEKAESLRAVAKYVLERDR